MFAPLRISLVLLLICGGIYPVLVALVGGTLFPYQAQGSIITQSDGTPVGSELIAQAFGTDIYFHPRPSAAGTDGYDATQSGGSNLGPTNQKLIDRVTGDAATLKQENPSLSVLPADLLTTSGSGLDPDISPEAAMAQVPRVAQARGISEQQVTDLVNSHITQPDLRIFGVPRVNVLKLNLALDDLAPQH
ncbi:MAG: potassium-transporting ATPase subunit KdpC [Chloroflexi bacterium]|nr:potassium-transporting ATPase subunit KdpC [Chloroflexota bacterium]